MSSTEAAANMARVLREVKFSLNACQLIIKDADARATVRDLVEQSNDALQKWESCQHN